MEAPFGLFRCDTINLTDMIKVIINADDFGKNPVVNQEIEAALWADLITSTTIMANSQYLPEVKRVVNELSDRKSFGVHLNITEGRSLTNSPVLKKAGIIDENGFFVKEHNFESRLYDELVKEAVTQEWDAQVNEVLTQGIEISHVDGHHHCHTWYGFTDCLVTVMERYKIKKVRNCYVSPVKTIKERVIDGVSECLMTMHLLDASKDMKMNRVLSTIRYRDDKIHYREKTSGYKKTNYFDAYETVLGMTGARALDCFVNNGETIELMCHPGHPNYRDEYEMIKEDKLGIRTNPNISLINYNEL